MTHSSTFTGVALVALASVLWGTTGTAQSLGAGGLSPFWVGAAQLAVASAFFLCVQALGRQRLAERPPVPRAWLALASLGIAGYSIAFYAGVRLAGVGVGTAVAIGSGPVWAGLIQAVFQRAPLPGLWWLGVAVSVGGGACMVLDKGAAAQPSWQGLALCLLAGLSYAGYALVNKRLVARAPSGWVNLRAFSGAAALALPAAWLLAGPPAFHASALAVVLYLGVVVSGLAYVAFSSGLRHISGATGVTLTLIEPVAAFALAILVVGEQPSALAFWGLGGVLAGLLVVIWAELRAAP